MLRAHGVAVAETHAEVRGALGHDVPLVHGEVVARRIPHLDVELIHKNPKEN